jgi:hypothetical protein
MLGNAVMHPLATAGNIVEALNPNNIGNDAADKNPLLQGVAGMVGNTVQHLQQGYQYGKEGNRAGAIREGFSAIPILGPGIDKAQDQAADSGMGKPGNSYAQDLGRVVTSPGAMGTLTGLASNIISPKAAQKPVTSIGRGIGAGLEVASADAPSLSLATTRALTKGSPGELLQSALKPGQKYGANAGDFLQKSIPDVLAANPLIKGVSGYAAASDAARDASFEPYNNLVSPYRSLNGAAGPVRPSAINGAPIADAQMRSIPAMDLIENPATPAPTSMKFINVPAGDEGTMRMGAEIGGGLRGGIINKTASMADNYRKPFSVPALDAVREDANGKLNAFYNKAGGDQAAALSSPETARVKAVGDSTRSILYPKLEEDAGLPAGSVADMQAKYGLLSDVSNIANKREPVFARHDPVTLGQKIAMSAGSNPLSTATKFLTQKALDKFTNSDALVNSAIDRFQNPGGTPLIARPGILPQNAMKLGKFLGGK